MRSRYQISRVIDGTLAAKMPGPDVEWVGQLFCSERLRLMGGRSPMSIGGCVQWGGVTLTEYHARPRSVGRLFPCVM